MNQMFTKIYMEGHMFLLPIDCTQSMLLPILL